MNKPLLTKLTADLQQHVTTTLMRETDTSRSECAIVAIQTAAAFQDLIKERVGVDE